MGNLLLKDEGIGVHVVRALQRLPLQNTPELTIIDAGTSPDAFDLVPEGTTRLVIVDAVRGGCEPGTVYRFTPDDVTLGRRTMTSLHQIGLLEGLRMMEAAGQRPTEVVIIGVEPKDIDWGLELSPELQAEVPDIIRHVEEELRRRPA